MPGALGRVGHVYARLGKHGLGAAKGTLPPPCTERGVYCISCGDIHQGKLPSPRPQRGLFVDLLLAADMVRAVVVRFGVGLLFV